MGPNYSLDAFSGRQIQFRGFLIYDGKEHDEGRGSADVYWR